MPRDFPDVVGGRYAVEKALGEGGFGRTLLAKDTLQGGRPAVIKLLPPSKRGLEREIEILRSLYHPHIVEVLAAGTLEDASQAPYLVMEYVDGEPFDAGLKDDERSWEAFAQLCRTLSYLHEEGVVHGDLKPSNVFITRREGGPHVKVIDFGLAVAIRSSKVRSSERQPAAGTLAYMAPEVIQKGARTAKSDLYALGILLYQLLHEGRLPFPVTSESVLAFHLRTSPEEMDLVPGAHRWKGPLEKILRRLLAKDPLKRPADALEVLIQLNRDVGASFPIHRGWEKTGDEAIFFQEVGEYLEQVGSVLQLPSVASPRSFLEEEEARIGKYRALLGRLKSSEVQALDERLQEIQGRIAIQRGDYKAVAQMKTTPSSDRLANVRALAFIYLEDYATAERTLKSVAQKASDAVDRARAVNYLGLAAYNQGKLDDAARMFEDSLKEMRAAGETTGIVSNTMNLGAVRQRQGRIAEALQSYKDALAAAEDLKNSFLLAMLLSNVANLHLSVGSLAEAEEYLKKSQALAESLQMHLLRGYNLLLESDAAAWRKDFEAVDLHLQAALQAFGKNPSPMFEAIARLHLAENALRAGRRRDAAPRLREAALGVAKSALPENRFRLEILKLRLQAAEKRDLDSVPKKLDALEREFGDDPRRRFQALATRAQWALAREDLEACGRIQDELKDLFEEEQKALPVAYRSAAADAPRYAPYFEVEETLRTRRKAPADASLWRLVEINRRIVSVRDPERLAEAVLDAGLELTGAERGFLVMPEYGKWKRGTWKVKAARHFRARDLPGGKDLLSQTIINRVLEGRKALLVQNALEEEDFREFKSVKALKLRSILAAPIVVHGEVLGALYLDHSKAASLFEEKDLNLLKALADQAGIALTNARLHEDSLRREKSLEETRAKLEDANRRLEDELKKKSEWAETVEEELKKAQVAGPIVARSAVMRHIIKQLPTLAKLRRPVLLVGETGVGKHFVAKILHQHAGVGPFVHEPCSNFPSQKSSPEGVEALAKAFEEARGGTLSLGEITDLPIPFQRELLKTLPDAPIFVILSTRIDPKEAAKKGLLLPELHRALTGSEIRIPPLRDRKEDVGPLVTHFLRDLSTTQGLHRAIKKATMGILHEYDWPGNIRELKIEIERAALASQTSITPTDLSPNVLGQAGFVPGAPKRETVELHDQRAQFEREYIMRVLEGTGWNKMRAAKKLGLSRAMLYIKLQKYKIPLK